MIDIKKLYALFLQSRGVTTDSRSIKKDCLFIALKGDNFNGNTFAEEALKKGAAFAVVDEKEYQTSERIFYVENGLKALQELALHHRKTLKTPVIALTGSNGKTTTKELVNAVLSEKYKTIATQGNLNNHIGVPLTLLRLQNDTDIAIVEMGANHQKEIAFLCSIAQPDYGFITNYGKAHLEGFGGVEGVIKGKSEMYDYLLAHKKFVFYNEDDPIQREKLKNHFLKKSFGNDPQNLITIHIADGNNKGFLAVNFNSNTLQTQLTGSYNLTNVAYAILTGTHFDVPDTAIVKAIESYRPQNNRSQLLEKGNNQIIMDAYNANPSSMRVALENLKMLEAKNKIAILGDMFELGEEAKAEHQTIAELAASLPHTTVYLVGKNFFGTQTPLQQFEDFETFKVFLTANKPEKSTILVKGSRGMALERVLEVF